MFPNIFTKNSRAQRKNVFNEYFNTFLSALNIFKYSKVLDWMVYTVREPGRHCEVHFIYFLHSKRKNFQSFTGSRISVTAFHSNNETRTCIIPTAPVFLSFGKLAETRVSSFSNAERPTLQTLPCVNKPCCFYSDCLGVARPPTACPPSCSTVNIQSWHSF